MRWQTFDTLTSPANVTLWIPLLSLSHEIVLVRGQLDVSEKHRFHLIWETRETHDTLSASSSPSTDSTADERVFGLEFMAADPRLMPCWYLMMCCRTKANTRIGQPCCKLLVFAKCHSNYPTHFALTLKVNIFTVFDLLNPHHLLFSCKVVK